MFKKNNPGCPCCTELCKIDSFTAEVEVTAADDQTIRPTLHPQSPYPAWVQVEILPQTGNVIRVYLGWNGTEDTGTASENDGLYAEYVADYPSSTLTLYRRDGTELASSTSTGTGTVSNNSTIPLFCDDPNSGYTGTGTGTASDKIWHRLTVCYDPDTGIATACFDAKDVRGWIIQGQCTSATVPADFVAGRQAGYGTGPAHTGTVSFRNYKFERLWYCDGIVPWEGTGTGTPNLDTTDDPTHVYPCQTLGDTWDYYNSLPIRTACHECKSGCTVVAETFAGLSDGPMPCGWDADATNWEVVDEMATGDGAICHTFDTTAGSYHVSATFDVGHLETQGDSVTMSLTHGSVTHSLTVTRVAGIAPEPPPYPDRYLWEFSGMTGYYTLGMAGTITLRICPRLVCNDRVNEVVEGVVVPGPVCVSITQPTLAGHEDASLTAFTIHKSFEMDEDCPECECTVDCEDCEFPAYVYVDLGPAFMTSQWGCDVCAAVHGKFALASYSPCNWIYAGESCFCHDPDCWAITPTGRVYGFSIWATYHPGSPMSPTPYWQVQIYIGPSPVPDPGSPCECGTQTNGTIYRIFGIGCDATMPLTLDQQSATAWPPAEIYFGTECYGKAPTTIRLSTEFTAI